MATLSVLPTFQEASQEARRLAAKFACDIGVQQVTNGWAVFGPVEFLDEGDWRKNLELLEMWEQLRQTTSAYDNFEEYEYDGLQLSSDGSDPDYNHEQPYLPLYFLMLDRGY